MKRTCDVTSSRSSEQFTLGRERTFLSFRLLAIPLENEGPVEPKKIPVFDLNIPVDPINEFYENRYWYNLEKSTGRSCIYRHEIPTPTPESEISTITDLENDITCHHITYKKADSELLQQLSDTELSSTDDNIVLNTIPPISTLNVNHKVQKKLQQQPLNHVMYQQDIGLQTPNNEQL
ncbi:hypothetical protein FQA39_LY02930 [Lamprigera yunnana]|nr:hypothetical protein FQA39_LY02930 [Lamprigera yunnana]